MSKKAQSGLSSVQRDWSDTQPPSSSQEIVYWPPTPPLTGAQQRLKDIQDALDGKPVATERVTSLSQPAKPLSVSQAFNKRTKPPSSSEPDPHPSKRARQLPWNGSSSSQPSTTRTNSLSSLASTKPGSIDIPPASRPNKSKVASVFLSSEQKHILELVQGGGSVFYTGSAGTGKSVLLREIIKALRKQHIKSSDAVAITASTGIAACNIGGVTIHSFAGIGLGMEDVDELVKKIKKNRKASTRWARTKVLIIDEVSMVDGDLFDKLSSIGSKLRKSPAPFGGIQLVVTGDFFQLPPVSKGLVKFAFEAQSWKSAIPRTFNLTKVFRQRDQVFVDMLNEMRFGRLSQRSIDKFKELSRPISYNDGIDSTELFPRREDVDRSNSTRMRALQTAEKVYVAKDSGLVEAQQRERLLSNFMAPQKLVLRTHAQVMLIKNTDEMLVNGSLGTITDFSTPEAWAALQEGGKTHAPSKDANAKDKKPVATSGQEYPVVEFVVPNGGKRQLLITPEQWKVELPNGEIQASRYQLPLILSWAMSIHKSQGQTLERVKVDLGKVFEKGQAYVALSRATSMDGLQVLNFDPRKVQVHPKVLEWSKTLETISRD